MVLSYILIIFLCTLYYRKSSKIILNYYFFEQNLYYYFQQEAIEETEDEDLTERSDEEDPLGDPLATDNQGFNIDTLINKLKDRQIFLGFNFKLNLTDIFFTKYYFINFHSACVNCNGIFYIINGV